MKHISTTYKTKGSFRSFWQSSMRRKSIRFRILQYQHPTAQSSVFFNGTIPQKSGNLMINNSPYSNHLCSIRTFGGLKGFAAFSAFLFFAFFALPPLAKSCQLLTRSCRLSCIEKKINRSFIKIIQACSLSHFRQGFEKSKVRLLVYTHNAINNQLRQNVSKYVRSSYLIVFVPLCDAFLFSFLFGFYLSLSCFLIHLSHFHLGANDSKVSKHLACLLVKLLIVLQMRTEGEVKMDEEF